MSSAVRFGGLQAVDLDGIEADLSRVLLAPIVLLLPWLGDSPLEHLVTSPPLLRIGPTCERRAKLTVVGVL